MCSTTSLTKNIEVVPNHGTKRLMKDYSPELACDVYVTCIVTWNMKAFESFIQCSCCYFVIAAFTQAKASAELKKRTFFGWVRHCSVMSTTAANDSIIVKVYGEMGSGKTALKFSMATGRSRPESPADLEREAFEIRSFDVVFDAQTYTFLIEDLMAQEVARAMAMLAISFAKIVFLTFKLDDYAHAEMLLRVCDEMENMDAKRRPLVVVVVGTHADQVPPDRRNQKPAEMARERGFLYYELCVWDFEAVEKMKYEVLRTFLRKTPRS